MCMVLLLILSQFFPLKGCLGEKPEKKDHVHAKLNCWEDACDQLVVNESKKTEEDPLERIVRLEQTLLSLGGERSGTALERVRGPKRLRNLIFFGIDESVES